MQSANHTQAINANPRINHLERRLLEAFDELWNSFVDPAEASYDADGQRWKSLSVAEASSLSRAPFASEEELAEIRGQCRALAAENEFAINGHENRISYIVGSGHSYRAMAKKGQSPDETLLREVQAALDDFVRENKMARPAAGNRPPQRPRRRVYFAVLFPPRTGSSACALSSPIKSPRQPVKPRTRQPPSASRPIRSTWKPRSATGSTAG